MISGHGSSEAASNNADISEIIDLARAYEPERYVAATLASDPARLALVALAAYAGDLARIPDTATQPMLGEIRLQWWRDTLDTIARGGRVGSPLADALAEAINSFSLPIPMLATMSEARAWDLYNDPMPDQASLDGYFSKTEAIPFELALRVLGVPEGQAGALSLPAGRAFGLRRLLCRLPVHLASGRMLLPPDMLATYELTPAMLLQGQSTVAVQALVDHLVAEVRGTLASLRPKLRPLSRRQRVAVLPLAVLSPYLRAIERRGRNHLRDTADIAPLARVWSIAVAHALGRI